MPFKSEIYRILIASPPELAAERRAAVGAVHDWNSRFSASEGVLLLPIEIDTAVAPAAGSKSKTAGKKRLIPVADILVGVFAGKENAVAGESGIVEELEQHIEADKPAMLYSSKRFGSGAKVNGKQVGKLRPFSAKIAKKAIVRMVVDVEELRTKCFDDLARQIRKINGDFRASRRHFARQVEMGPNGYRVGYTKNGDKAEFVRDPQDEGFPWVTTHILRRNDNAIVKAQNEFRDKVWWNLNRRWVHRIATGKEQLKPGQKQILADAKKNAKRLERKYGRKNLGWDDIEWGVVCGKLSALAWVMGSEWEESMDT